MNDKKSAQKVWSKDLVCEKTFRLPIRTPHAFTISYELKEQFSNLNFKKLNNQ